MATNKKAAAPAAPEKEVRADFFTRNSKLIYGCLIGAVVLIIAGFLFFNHRNKMKEASANKSAVAIAHMEQAVATADSTEFRLALEGDEENPGFRQLLDEYGARGGEAIYLNTAICELNLGLYEDALAHARKYDTDDPVMASRAQLLIGHAQMQLGQYAAAKKSFLEAAKVDSELAAAPLLNAGLAAEKLGQLEEALDCYKKIANRYSTDALYSDGVYFGELYEGNKIDIHIARVEALIEKSK